MPALRCGHLFVFFFCCLLFVLCFLVTDFDSFIPATKTFRLQFLGSYVSGFSAGVSKGRLPICRQSKRTSLKFSCGGLFRGLFLEDGQRGRGLCESRKTVWGFHGEREGWAFHTWVLLFTSKRLISFDTCMMPNCARIMPIVLHRVNVVRGERLPILC